MFIKLSLCLGPSEAVIFDIRTGENPGGCINLSDTSQGETTYLFSLTGFVAHSISRFKLVKYGENISHRLNILSYAVLSSAPNVIRQRLPHLDKKLKELC